MIVSPILIGFSSASFSISVRDSGVPITTYFDLAVLARSRLDSNILHTSLAPLLASSSVSLILAISSWKIKLFSSISPIFAEAIPLVIPSTAQPMFRDEARAAAKLPCPVPFIIVAPSVSPNGVNIDIFVFIDLPRRYPCRGCLVTFSSISTFVHSLVVMVVMSISGLDSFTCNIVEKNSAE